MQPQPHPHLTKTMASPRAAAVAMAEANALRAVKDVAPFLKQLRNMLNEEHPSVLRWSANGRAFEIVDMEQMSEYVLPKYFKHRKYTSFQRQLNYFNFRKWTKSKATVCTFSNEYFQRDQPELAWRITRKKSVHGPLHHQLKPQSPSARRGKTLPLVPSPSLSSPVPSPAATQFRKELPSPAHWTKSSPSIANISVPTTSCDDMYNSTGSFPSPTDLDAMLKTNDYTYAATLHFADQQIRHHQHQQLQLHHHHQPQQSMYSIESTSADSQSLSQAQTPAQAEQFAWIDALLPFVDRIEDDVYPFMYAPPSHPHPMRASSALLTHAYDYVAL